MQTFLGKIAPDITAAIVVSFLTIAGGAAFGVLTGLGVQVGIMSMVIASLAGWIFGGLPIKAMGPTGPSTSAMFLTMGALSLAQVPQTAVFIIVAAAGVILFLLSFLNIKKIMAYIPNLGTAVFINGVSAIILVDQSIKLFNYYSEGSQSSMWSFGIGLGSLLFLFIWKNSFKGLKMTKVGQLLSGSLLVMIGGGAVNYFAGNIADGVEVGGSIIPTEIAINLNEINQIPTGLFLYSSLKMALIVFFVTVISTRALNSGESEYNAELRNAGFANIVVALFGGIASTIGFIRSRMLKDNRAKTLFAGIAVALFVLLLVVFASPLLAMIPVSVFVAVLIYAAWVGFDWQFLTDFKNNPKKNYLTFIMVLVGSILMLWFDQILIVLVASALWHLFQKLKITSAHCPDIENCPIASQDIKMEV